MIRYLIKDSIEDRMMDLQCKKRAIVDGALSTSGSSTSESGSGGTLVDLEVSLVSIIVLWLWLCFMLMSFFFFFLCADDFRQFLQIESKEWCVDVKECIARRLLFLMDCTLTVSFYIIWLW